MTKSEIAAAVSAVKEQTAAALHTMYDAMNQGQQKQIVKNDAVKVLFDRYGVQYKD